MDGRAHVVDISPISKLPTVVSGGNGLSPNLTGRNSRGHIQYIMIASVFLNECLQGETQGTSLETCACFRREHLKKSGKDNRDMLRVGG